MRPPGFRQGRAFCEDLRLDFRQILDVGWLEAPADIDAAADDSGVRAWHVEEDGIEGFVETFRGWLAPVVDGDFVGFDAEAGKVFLKAGDALFVRVGAGEAAASAERGGDEECLPAGGGAGIEDFFTGFRGEEIDAVAGGGILDVDRSGGEELGGEFPFEQEIVRGVIESMCRGRLGIGPPWASGLRRKKVSAGWLFHSMIAMACSLPNDLRQRL